MAAVMAMEDRKTVRPLFEGPVDIIGDVHGERTALESLLRKLGYDDRGRHREGRSWCSSVISSIAGPTVPACFGR